MNYEDLKGFLPKKILDAHVHFFRQESLYLKIILDYAVMDYCEGFVLAQMRVRVDIGRRAVGGPAGMADAY